MEAEPDSNILITPVINYSSHGIPGSQQSGINTVSSEARSVTRSRLASVKCGARLPVHLAHPLKDERAVIIHALRPTLQGSRQNRSEPCRLLAVDIPGRGSVIVTTRRLCTINTRAPFNHVEIDLQNAPLAESEFGHRYQCELRAFAENRPARSEK